MGFNIFWRNPVSHRQLHDKETLLRQVKVDMQVTALSKTERRFNSSIYSWRGHYFQHWPSYCIPGRERYEPFHPAAIPTLVLKSVGLGSQSFGFENDPFLMKRTLFRKLSPSTTGNSCIRAVNTSSSNPRVKSLFQRKLHHPTRRRVSPSEVTFPSQSR